jgi:hypothetical protein
MEWQESPIVDLHPMESNPTRKSSTAFEYFLYAAILAETGLAALVYKTIFESPDLARLRVYFAIFYFGFLAWAIAQLNELHRNRKAQQEAKALAAPAAGEIAEDEPMEAKRAGMGLASWQLLVVVLVFATAVAAFTWVMRTLL